MTTPHKFDIIIKLSQEKDSIIEVWLSLVERFVRDEEAAGSNPVTSTIFLDRPTR